MKLHASCQGYTRLSDTRHFNTRFFNTTLPRLQTKQRQSGVIAVAYSVSEREAQKKKVVVVGGGFAGFGAAKTLAEQGYDVTIVDGAENPGGLSAGWRTPKGRAVEAGIKGFWYQYHNIFKLVKELDIPWPFTNWTTSGFWSPSGLTTEAPVFSSKIRLPALVGQFVHTAPLYWSLPLSERATMLPWLWSILDVNSSADVYERYDHMTAKELFQRFNVSDRMYNEFLRPTLLVGLFAEPENLSAAAVLNTLYFYALAHQADFDVCWCRGSVSEKIFMPLVENIKQVGGQIMGSTFVTDIKTQSGRNEVSSVVVKSKDGSSRSIDCDALIFAVGITGMQKLVAGSQVLSRRPEFSRISNLQSIDVISVRIWLDKKIDFQYPANVLAGFERHAGSTFFDLNALQDEYRDAPGSVIGSDFYGATELLNLSDKEIVEKVVENIARCDPRVRGAKVEDAAVLKFAKAVSHFSVGSHKYMPEQRTSLNNVFIAGDWVKNIDHGANGLSQERAYVTGLMAANFVVERLGVGRKTEILPVEADEPHIAFGKQATKVFRGALQTFGLDTALLP